MQLQESFAQGGFGSCFYGVLLHDNPVVLKRIRHTNDERNRRVRHMYSIPNATPPNRAKTARSIRSLNLEWPWSWREYYALPRNFRKRRNYTFGVSVDGKWRHNGVPQEKPHGKPVRTSTSSRCSTGIPLCDAIHFLFLSSLRSLEVLSTCTHASHQLFTVT